jgi:hypothetical protein
MKFKAFDLVNVIGHFKGFFLDRRPPVDPALKGRCSKCVDLER